MSKIKRLAGETVLYGLGSIVPRFLNFLLVPLHTAVFEPEAYGIITKLMAYVAVVNTIYMFGMETAYFRFANKSGMDEQRVFNLTQTAVIVISGILTLTIIVFSRQFADALEIASRPDLLIWLALVMFIDAVVAIPFARLRHQKKALKFALAKICNIVIFIALNFYFLSFLYSKAPDVGFVFIANLAANAFFVLFFIRTLLSWRPTFDKQLSPTIFKYGYPIMLTGLAGVTNDMFSRITLDKWLPENFYPGKSTTYALGVLGASYKLAVLMGLGTMAFRYAAEPFFFSNAAEKNSPQLFARVNHYFIIAGCFVLLSVSINLDVIKYFLAKPAYWEALHIVPILLLSYLFSGVYYNFSVWFKLTDQTYYGTIFTIGGAVVTIIANYILIPLAGYEGSSWAALLTTLSMTWACYIFGQKYYPIPYKILKGLGYILITTFIIYAVKSLDAGISRQILATSFHFLVITIFAFCVYLIEWKGFKKKQA